MKIDDFLKEFPNKWRIYYNRPQLERKLGEASTEKLIKRLEEWIERYEKGEAQLKAAADLKKVGFVGCRKDNLLSQVDRELGESEKKKRLMELKTWFERLEDEQLEESPIESNLKNDLFFGFLIMFKFRNEGMWFKEAIGSRENSANQIKFYEQLRELAAKVPLGEHPWRRKWKQKFLNLIEEWHEVTGVEEIHKIRVRNLPMLKKIKPHVAGKAGQKNPKINHEISRYLRERLAEKLKGRRDRRDDEDNRVANDKRAAELIAECAKSLGIKVEDPNRLRKPMKPRKPQTPPKP